MDLSNPALTVGLAMAAGVVSQVVARHLAMPGIVALLVSGVLLGPDIAGLIRPDVLGGALRMLVGFAVAVILFDGGMNLDIRRLRQEGLTIRRLVTVGALITAFGGALAARHLLGWEWRLAVLFGTLVIVTGPTVVTPLVRRLRLREPVGTILEAEGVLIDPVGAIVAVVALEVLYAGDDVVAAGLGTAAAGLGTGALLGVVSGAIMTLLLRPRRLVPVGLENILVLSLVVALFQLSEAVRPESGLATVVVAGLVVGNVKTRVSRELLDFKEQLTVLMIGMLFVLLAADVRLADVHALGWRGVATVAALMLVVRPAQVWACTVGVPLGWRERAFLASMAPRGIVAAAVASLFAEQLAERGVAEGSALRALVFLVIAVTVTTHGLTGGWVAAALRLRRPAGNGFAILGANALAQALGRVLEDGGHEVVLVDSNVDRVAEAHARGFRVLHGQGLQREFLDAIEPDSRIGCIGLTPNEEVNLLFVQRVREEARHPALWVALRHESDGIPAETVHAVRAAVLFGRPRRLEEWIDRVAAGSVAVQVWTLASSGDADAPLHAHESFLVLAVRRRTRLQPYDDETSLSVRDDVVVAIEKSRASEAEAALGERGLTGPRPMATTRS